MTTLTAVGRPTPVVGRRTLAELALAEIRYTLRSPLLWAALVLHAFLAWAPRLNDTLRSHINVTDEYSLWDHLFATPLVLAAFFVGNAAGLRERPTTTSEMFSPTPAARWDRTVGVLSGSVVPAVMALTVTSVQVALIAADGGLPLGDPPHATQLPPTPLEALGIPLFAACAFVAGVALARVVRSRAIGAMVGVIGGLALFGAFWLWYIRPMAYVALSRNALVTHDLGEAPSADELARYVAVDEPDRFVPSYVGFERDLTFYSVHLVFVVGVIGVLAGIALLRSGRDRRTWWVLAAGTVLAVASVLWQVLVFDGPIEWLGQ
jgi:hypothetical protein